MLLVSSLTLLMIACGRSGVEHLGDGLYSTGARGYHQEAANQALKRAEAHCAKDELRVLAEDIRTRELDPGFYQATLTFRCLDPDHPDLPRLEF